MFKRADATPGARVKIIASKKLLSEGDLLSHAEQPNLQQGLLPLNWSKTQLRNTGLTGPAFIDFQRKWMERKRRNVWI